MFVLQGDFPNVLKCSKSCSLLQLCIIQTMTVLRFPKLLPAFVEFRLNGNTMASLQTGCCWFLLQYGRKKVFGTSWDKEELYKTVCVSATHQRKVLQGSKHLVDTSQFLISRFFFKGIPNSSLVDTC